MEKVNLLEVRQNLLETQRILRERIQQAAQGEADDHALNPTSSDLAGRYDLEQRQRLLLSRAEQQLSEVQAALERLDHGTYGKCIQCGQPIHPERLAVLPATAYCVQCKQEQE